MCGVYYACSDQSGEVVFDWYVSGHCYFGVFVCVDSGMCVSALVCFEWSVMQVG